MLKRGDRTSVAQKKAAPGEAPPTFLAWRGFTPGTVDGAELGGLSTIGLCHNGSIGAVWLR